MLCDLRDSVSNHIMIPVNSRLQGVTLAGGGVLLPVRLELAPGQPFLPTSSKCSEKSPPKELAYVRIQRDGSVDLSRSSPEWFCDESVLNRDGIDTSMQKIHNCDDPEHLYELMYNHDAGPDLLNETLREPLPGVVLQNWLVYAVNLYVTTYFTTVIPA